MSFTLHQLTIVGFRQDVQINEVELEKIVETQLAEGGHRLAST